MTATFGAGSAPMRVISWFHWVVLMSFRHDQGRWGGLAGARRVRAALAAAAAVSGPLAAAGRKPTWMWFQCSGIASVFGAPGYCIRLMIWWGTNSPCSVSSARIVRSVIVPAPWWPAIGMPLIAEMSTASPV